jgi:CHAD domain-containing protein
VTAAEAKPQPTAHLVRLGEPLTAAQGDPPERHVLVALDSRLRALLEHETGVRSGEDPEDLHRMRVSVRRMRAVLRAARPLVDAVWADQLRAELGWLGRALGPVRDMDVLLAQLRADAEALGGRDAEAAQRLLVALERERAVARTAMIAALDDVRYADLLLRLADAVRGPLPPPSTEDGGRPALTSLVRKEFRRLRKTVNKAGWDPPDAVLHQLRIYGKRLRYTAELAEPALGKPVRNLLTATVAMQDVLGDHQDACVAQQRVRALLADLGDAATPDVAFAAGRLVERAEFRRIDRRKRWPTAWQNVNHAAEQALTATAAI